MRSSVPGDRGALARLGKSSRLLRHKWCIYFLIAVTKVVGEQKLILAHGFRVQPILVGKVGWSLLVVVAECNGLFNIWP